MNNSHHKSRSRSLPTESSFSKELYSTGEYFSDYDLIVTDNSTYHQYVFVDGEYSTKPRIKRIIEIKFDATDYVKKLMKNEILPNAQTLAFASLVDEVNLTSQDKIQLWFIIQSEGDYPYFLFEFKENKFDYVKSIDSREEFIKALKS